MHSEKTHHKISIPEMGSAKVSTPNDNFSDSSIVPENGKREDGFSITEAADFETAIAKTEYGKFNLLLMLITIPCCLASQFDTTTGSYVIAVAECDLDLNFADKGNLNGVIYAGMISSAFCWGFLSDTLGRKKLLVYGYLLDAVCNIFVTVSQTKTMMMVFKFLSGFVICGPFAVLMTYTSELHGLQYRARVMLFIGICFSIGNILLPALGWLILPRQWEVVIIADSFVLHPWQFFLAACSVPPLLAGILVMTLPESPKFLMSRGRNEAALKELQKIYSINTGKAASEYPIKSLVNELQINTVSKQVDAEVDTKKKEGFFHSGFAQFGQMFQKPHLHNAILVYTIQFGLLFGLNSLRLWVPQLFNIIIEYEHDAINQGLEGPSDLCTMIEHKINKTQLLEAPSYLNGTDVTVCKTVIDDAVYINSIIIGIVHMFGYLLAGSIINALGNKRLLIGGLFISGSAGIALSLARDATGTLILSSLYTTISSVCSTALVGTTVVMFPTSLRTMIVSLLMMFGRTGAIIGNMLFPLLLGLGCLPPFLLVGGITIVCSFVCFLLPKTIKKPLQ